MRALLEAFLVLSLTGLVLSAVTDQQFKQLQQTVTNLNNKIKALENANKAQEKSSSALEAQNKVIVGLARQVSQQQLYVEEMTRSHGDSGLKLTRLTRTGSKPYFATTFVDQRIAAIHDHSNYKDTVGMGELIAVLNGVEFRTRHNDYKMARPSTTSDWFGQTEVIPYPEVPPAVLAKPTIQEQIKEMREWFKAWRDSDYTKRDYRKYFTANLCYLEGQWTVPEGEKLNEPFSSARHAIDAKSFFDLQKKIQYTSVTGRKSRKENYAYLPTTISSVDDYGNIAYSQWNYQILCHPLKRHVPLTRFRLEEDIGPRVANGKTREQMIHERSARFSLYEDLTDTPSPSTKDRYVKDRDGTFLDILMYEIPGKDNYMANLTDSAFGETAYPINTEFSSETKEKPKPLNVGYYHNAYKVDRADAMGTSINRRGFSDVSLYVAYNSTLRVQPVSVEGDCVKNKKCTTNMEKAGSCKRETCSVYTNRVSYAVPLEIVYTTPLNTWNPYKFTNHRNFSKPVHGNKVNNLNRNGGLTKERAFFGVTNSNYYLTPSEFFETSTSSGKADPADTVRKNDIGVLDPAGNVRRVVPSGISISTKEIPGVGKMRIRYPIMPIHDYGNVVYKHLSALTDMTLKKHKYEKLYPDMRRDNGTVEEVFVFETRMSDITPPDPHLHTIELTSSEIETMKSGTHVKGVTTSTNGGHNHVLDLYYNQKSNIISIRKCDGQDWECWDGHRWRLTCPDCSGGHPVN